MKFRILTVVGTRPNYVKVSRFTEQFSKYPDLFEHQILHTGQHYDILMKEVFFHQLGFSKIDYALEIESVAAAAQIGEIMIKMNDVLSERKPDLMIVVGDVNSTLAAALIASKLNIKLAHLESGLRSFDRDMPEEINRIVTDNLADILFVTEKSGLENLTREGKGNGQVFFIGNTMIDTLISYRSAIDQSPIMEQLGLNAGNYTLVTMHRPSNVDSIIPLKKILQLLILVSSENHVVFSAHPRTLKKMTEFGFIQDLQQIKNLQLIDPQDYFSFQKLLKNCLFVLTDSGGIQEEATFYGVPCLTLRNNTERPITVELGTNELVSLDLGEVAKKIAAIRSKTFKEGSIPPLWDGNATERMVNTLRMVL